MKLLDVLKKEHETIMLNLASAEKEIPFMRETGTVHKDVMDGLLSFFRDYVGVYHHAREEKYLFSRMEGRVEEEFDPVVVMLAEHDLFRKLIKMMFEILPKTVDVEGAKTGISSYPKDSDICCSVIPASAANMLIDNLLTYMKLLRKHIGRENDIIFPLAEKVLTPEELVYIEETSEPRITPPKRDK